MGQIEADEATAKAREDVRLRAERERSDVMDNVSGVSAAGENVPPPTPDKGTLSS
jgi:hypothetical protein